MALLSKVGTVTGWVIGCLAIISAIGSFSTEPLSSFLWLCIAALALPPAARFIQRKWKRDIPVWSRVAVGIVLLFVFGLTSEEMQQGMAEQRTITRQQEQERSVEAEEKRKAKEEQRKQEAEQKRLQDEQDDTVIAWVCAQDRVEAMLKAPRSAKFPWSSSQHVTALGENKYAVAAYVDAQNSFGAMIRTNFACLVQYIPSTDSCVTECEFEQ